MKIYLIFFIFLIGCRESYVIHKDCGKHQRLIENCKIDHMSNTILYVGCDQLVGIKRVRQELRELCGLEYPESWIKGE